MNSFDWYHLKIINLNTFHALTDTRLIVDECNSRTRVRSQRERELDMDGRKEGFEQWVSPFRRFNFLAPWRTGLGVVRSAKIRSFFHVPRGKDSFPSFPCDFQKVVRRRDTVHSFTIHRVSLYLY